ncbi:hypothetical protein DACRYDRAFT_14959 [Dacryopinax primogenitus]|uniref:Uncharacterized protein n=1 Tax=Dacryopinax primogenitus (strain DJM 731) TaxID=1858805 RepID=M5G472_DACPD|nr:uncharacterized protein DACRYDRAFT_14959 [Dacryopinax primogenitus]EJU03015.1 hypothetical protein DACRYDRAFT_14959 [Dacryopinax primogenitus]
MPCDKKCSNPSMIDALLDHISSHFPGHSPFATVSNGAVNGPGSLSSAGPVQVPTTIWWAQTDTTSCVIPLLACDTDGYHSIAALCPVMTIFKIRACVLCNTGATELKSKPGFFVSNLVFGDATERISEVAWTPNAICKCNQLKIGKVYSISGGQIIEPPGQYLVGSPFQIKFMNRIEIRELPDDGKVPALKYDFVKLKDIGSVWSGSFDILVVVNMVREEIHMFNMNKDCTCAPVDLAKTFIPASHLFTPVDKGILLQELQVLDTSGYASCVVLWEQDSESFNAVPGDVIVIQAV